MTTFFKYLKSKRSLQLMFALGLFFLLSPRAYADKPAAAEKISPSIKLSYKIHNGVKTVKVAVSYKEEKKFIPVGNIIVNLYLGEVKKFDKVSNDGWMGNLVTDDEGECVFMFPENFNKLKANVHSFNFIASIGSDPKYEDTQEEITVNDMNIKLSFVNDSLTTVNAKLCKIQDSGMVPVPETEMKLLVKRTFGALPFGEDNLTTDADGLVSGVLPADLPGNANKSITIMARYEDQENEGIVEVSQDIPWKILPRENKLSQRTLWSSGHNAPIVLVVVTVSLIILIWGTISYLVILLLRIRKLR